MAKKFEIVGSKTTNSSLILEKASATVIAAWDLVALDAGWLAIVAVAGSTAVAYCEGWAATWTTECNVNNDTNLILEWTADANFAKTHRWTEVDITAAQLVDVWASVTDVLKILPSENAGTVGSTLKVKVQINKPL